MSRLFVINDTLANKISFYHLMLLMASLPFDMFYSHLILISLAIHTLIQLNKRVIKPVFTLRTLTLQSVFFITVLSTIYAVNKAAAFEEWGKQLTIFIIPPLFCLNPLDLKKYRSQLLLSFSVICTATIVYLYLDAFITIRHYHLPLSSIFAGAFTNHNFSQPINIHATFFSMQVAISLVYLITLLINEKSVYTKRFYLMCCCILIAGLLQLSSKSVFIALLIIINIAIPYFLLQNKRRRKFVLTTSCLSLLLILGILCSGRFRDRYVNGLRNDLSKVSADADDTRLARWGVSIGLINKAPLLGYGAGSEIPLLQDNFFRNKLYSSYLNKLNTHSQYLSFLLKAGVAGLLIYLLTLAFGFNISLRQKDILFFAFMALVAIVSLSENLLDVDKGIFFYAFFFSFFIFSGNQQSNTVKAENEHKYFTIMATKQLVTPS
jgi:O-antigen ligase